MAIAAGPMGPAAPPLLHYCSSTAQLHELHQLTLDLPVVATLASLLKQKALPHSCRKALLHQLRS
jgi:hypothetical protein